MSEISLFCVFGDFQDAIFFKRATHWVTKLYAAEVPNWEPLTEAAATAPINRKFMNLYCSSSLLHGVGRFLILWSGESQYSEKYDCSLCSLHKLLPDATPVPLSLSI